MATQVTLPRLSPGMNEASVARWLKRTGEQVARGEALFEVETEKVATEVPAPADGVLSIVVPEGTTVPIGAVLAVLAAPGEAVSPPQPGGGQAEGSAAAPVPSPLPAQRAPGEGQGEGPAGGQADALTRRVPSGWATSPPFGWGPFSPPPPGGSRQAVTRQPERDSGAPAAAAGEEGRIIASPAARRLGRELGVALEGIRGSGPGGRVIEKDVQRAADEGRAAPAAAAPATAAAAPAAPPPTPVTAEARTRPLQGMRRTIAERMLLSQNTNATVTITLEVDMHEAVNLRSQLVAEWESREGVRVSYTDVVVKAVAKALTEHRRLNASLQGDPSASLRAGPSAGAGQAVIVEHGEIHVGVAVALDDGLIVPVVRNADRRSLLEIAKETKELGQRAQQGKLAVADVTGGTFTVTNLGTSGVDAFTPIINPPECAILGVGKIAEKPVARGGQVVIRPLMWLSLTFDHRIVDGKPAAEFLRRVQEILEKPYLIFV
ncbi:MAG TPA: dihydrolipoamide acetyltransferase family protein [Chloroflexota bacterium]|nr:dihydrolipoamide acetyltransferase family protein [Chloroflexota bacterium]